MSRLWAQSLLEHWLARRYRYLFYTLLLTLIVMPLLVTLGLSETLLDLFILFNLAAAITGIRNRRLARLLLLVFFLAFALRIVSGAQGLSTVANACTIAFIALGFIAGSDAVHFAMRLSRANAEHLYAALSVYILLGLLFGMLHWATELEWQGAYTLPADESFSLESSIYFSFVTQTTLGFGDILPKSALARGLTILQAIVGQLYLTVMLASLVSLRISDAGKKQD
jgi:hypothetical protein